MENEKQNDVVEELVPANEPATEPTSGPEALATETTPVVEAQPEVILEPVSVENNVDAPVVENNNLESEAPVNNEVILEPVPSQAEVALEPVPAEAAPVVDAPVDAPAVVATDAVNPVDTPATNMDVPNVNAGVGPEAPAATPVAPVGGEVVTPGEEKPKKKKTGLIIAIIVVLVAVLAVVGVFVAKSMASNPYKLFNALVDKGYTEVSNALKEADKKAIKYNFDDTILLSGNVKLNSSVTELESYLAYDYDYKLGLDPKGEKVELGLSMNKGGQVTIDAFMYIIKDMMYIKSEKAYSNVLYYQNDESIFADVNFDEFKTNYTVDDVNKLIELYLGYVKAAVKEDKFVTEEGTIKYNGEDLEVNKIKYELTKDEQYEFATSVYEDMKADNEFKDLVMKITGYTAGEYDEEILLMKPEKEEYEDANTVTYYIYTKGFFPTVMGFGMTDGTDVMNFVGEDEKYEFNLTSEDMTLNANINGDVIEGSVKDEEANMTFRIEVKETDNGSDVALNVSMTEEGQSYSVAVNLSNKKVNDKNATNKLTLNVSMPGEGTTVTAGLELTNEILIGGKVAEVDTTGAVNVATLTEADYQTILNNIETVSAGSPLELLITLMKAESDPEEPVVNYNIEELIKG